MSGRGIGDPPIEDGDRTMEPGAQREVGSMYWRRGGGPYRKIAQICWIYPKFIEISIAVSCIKYIHI